MRTITYGGVTSLGGGEDRRRTGGRDESGGKAAKRSKAANRWQPCVFSSNTLFINHLRFS